MRSRVAQILGLVLMSVASLSSADDVFVLSRNPPAITQVDIASLSVRRQMPVASTQLPVAIGASPDGRILAVTANPGSCSAQSELLLIDRKSLRANIVLLGGASGPVVMGRKHIYVADRCSTRISVIDASTGAIATDVGLEENVDAQGASIALWPDDHLLAGFLLGATEGRLGLSPCSSCNLQTIRSGVRPVELATSDDGDEIHFLDVATSEVGIQAALVRVAANGETVSSIELPEYTNPTDLAVSRGGIAYVSDLNSARTLVFDENTMVGVIPTGVAPVALALTNDEGLLVSANAGDHSISIARTSTLLPAGAVAVAGDPVDVVAAPASLKNGDSGCAVSQPEGDFVWWLAAAFVVYALRHPGYRRA